jgi:hypothetical protein
MKIHCFGDSWAFGVGVESEPESTQLDMNDRYDKNCELERSLYS